MNTLNRIDLYLNEKTDHILKQVQKFLKSERTWFQDDGSDENVVVFVTRDNGSVGDEKPGKEDFKEAQRLKKIINKKFKNKVNIQIDDVDEWTHIEVTEK